MNRPQGFNPARAAASLVAAERRGEHDVTLAFLAAMTPEQVTEAAAWTAAIAAVLLDGRPLSTGLLTCAAYPTPETGA